MVKIAKNTPDVQKRTLIRLGVNYKMLIFKSDTTFLLGGVLCVGFGLGSGILTGFFLSMSEMSWSRSSFS